VKVLDAASLPERKSFPQGRLTRLLGTFLVTALRRCGGGALGWTKRTRKIRGKRFAQEVLQTVQGRMPWAEPNGSRVQAAAHKVWVRLVRRGEAEKPSPFPAN